MLISQRLSVLWTNQEAKVRSTQYLNLCQRCSRIITDILKTITANDLISRGAVFTHAGRILTETYDGLVWFVLFWVLLAIFYCGIAIVKLFPVSAIERCGEHFPRWALTPQHRAYISHLYFHTHLAVSKTLLAASPSSRVLFRALRNPGYPESLVPKADQEEK